MFYQYPAISDENLFQQLCKDIYNALYQTEDFQLYKTKGAAQFGIDSYSLRFRTVIQSKKKKLLRSDKAIEKELLADLKETLNLVKRLPFTFDELVFATNTKRYSVIEDYAAQQSQLLTFRIKFISWEELEVYISEYLTIRKKYYPQFDHEADEIPKILTTMPPVAANDVIGRAADLTRLEQLVTAGSPTILIHGMGGIGKTTLLKLAADALLENYDHILWIDYAADEQGNYENDFLIKSFIANPVLLKNLKLNFEPGIALENAMQILLNKLANMPGKNLLMVDNAPLSIMRVRNQLPGFPRWQALITSRIKIPFETIIELPLLDQDASVLLFQKFYLLESDVVTTKWIVEQIGNHTLTIELLAKTAQKRSFKLKELSQMLKEEGLNISRTAKVTTEHDPTGLPTHLMAYLKKIFSLAGLDTKQQHALSFFSVLRSDYVIYDDLKLLFAVLDDDNDFFDLITELAGRGWLLQENNSYTMHQVIQEVIREQLQPDPETVKPLIISLTDLLLIDWDGNPIKTKRFIAHAQHMINYIPCHSSEMATLCNALGLRLEDFDEFGPAVNNYHAAEAFYKTRAEEYEDDLAGIYNNLQSVYKTLGSIDNAIDYQYKALKIQERISQPPHFDIGASYNNLALLYDIKGNLNLALTLMEKSLAIAENAFSGEHPNLASTYSTYASLLSRIGEDNKALGYQLKAFEMRKRVLEAGHPQLDESRNNLAAVYEGLNQLDKAETLFNESLDFKKQYFGEESFTLGTTFNNLAAIYIKRRNYIKAEEYQLQAIALEINGLGEMHYEVANSYSTLAVIKDGLRQYHESIQCAEKAIEIYRYNFPGGHNNIEMYEQYIRMIQRKIPVASTNSIGRNQLCPCGSQKKYKHCCGRA
ncbi:tetratricopeptide repeat protein [Mucilaginibacter roseus]|uniref:Tetratricopeptide repeat protein n=1 Tax=Mucilaginibacter roseus TaxID=1528868 RepID=A0ABS8TZ41_9SPHI|nr:tetratricopeptide repeat protein [Mucilaginibacter roseus]MCD8739055.1 tetratricopeptide repeat protein [Mucilaginibacter roseus]